MPHQPANFIFKLRQNIALEGDLALARMELEAFLPQGVTPAPQLDAPTLGIPGLAELPGLGALTSHTRPEGIQGYTASGSLARLPELIRCLSFIQRIYCYTYDTPSARGLQSEIENRLGAVIACHSQDEHLIIQAIPHYALFELSHIVARHSSDADATKRNLRAVLNVLLGRANDPRARKLAEKALQARATTAHLSHNIHYYKAKFFPRLARSLLNVCVQQLGGDYSDLQAIDNFSGSGTLLLEAASLGIPNLGLDIDPLSVLIARTKRLAVEMDSSLLTQQAAEAIQHVKAYQSAQHSLFDPPPVANLKDFAFPDWLLKNRKMTPVAAEKLAGEIAALQSTVDRCDPRVRDLFNVLLSDAISRRVRMRFLGTGVGRFWLTFSKTPLATLFTRSLENHVKVAATGEWLRSALRLRWARTQVVEADARHLPADLGPFDLLITSPPYLPASSGRESYTKARALSLIALEMYEAGELDELIDDSIGAMNGNGVRLDALTSPERALVDWLRQDELRQIKAEPTARYFLDMRRAFAEMRHILRPGALAVVVSGKQSTFYQFSTREPLYVVPAAELLAEEAEQAGFEVTALHDVMLHKANRNARPRSLDDYYETLIMLRRP